MRAVVRWLFPVPHTIGRWVWAAFCFAYLAFYTYVCVESARYDYSFDAAANGASLGPLGPVIFGFPSSLLAFLVPVDGSTGQDALVLYSAFGVLGAFQCWVVWRVGLAAADASINKGKQPDVTSE